LRTLITTLLALSAAAFGQGDLKRISTADALAAATAKVQPEYPAFAKQLKVHGSTEVEAVIAEDGTVEKVNIVSGNPMLTKAAADALKRWKFKPFMTEGKAVKAVALLGFDFKM